MTCNENEDMFKGFLSNWLTFTALIAPHTANEIIPRIQRSALGAAGQCFHDKSCGRRWCQDIWDGSSTMESDMSALSVFSSALVVHKDGAYPMTPGTGATSKGNPNAGIEETGEKLRPITAGDRAGAVIATVLFISGWIWGFYWLMSGNERIEGGQRSSDEIV